ncbi:MAG: YkgJ family cysteine cluster protein [Pseudomonadota bacterium]
MGESQVYFSEAHVEQVAKKIKEISKLYEQLFADFGAQLFSDIADLSDASKIMQVCVSHIETAVLAFGRHFPDSSVIACTRGCCHCCSFPIECPPQVVVDVARHIRNTWSFEDQHLLRQKLTHDMSARQLPFNRAPCPLLDKDRLCSIYEKRPLSCRWFTSPDAALCEKSVQDGSNITQHPVGHRIYQVATTMLLACEKKQGRPYVQVPFVSSLLEILEIPKETTVWRGYHI